MRRVIKLLLAIFLTSLLPFAALAVEGADQYADSVYETIHVTDAEQSLGAPDGTVALFHEDDSFATLDMGSEMGVGNLKMYYVPFDQGPSFTATFMDEEFLVLQEISGDLSLSYSEVTIDYTAEEPYRYVKLTSTDEDDWGVDAIKSDSFVTDEEPVPEEPPAEEPTPEEDEPASPQGLIVKLVDDGNPDTWTDATVYVIDDTFGRHVFPNETVFLSWWPDFEDLAYIDDANLSGYTLGNNVTIRPGTNLVKITTDPKVYAVEPGGILRWVSSEEIAEGLWGADWASRVVDVADVFFGNYEMGDPIDTLVHPSGTLGFLSMGAVVYIENGVYYRIPGDIYGAMRFQSQFLVSISAELEALYVDGGYLTDDPSVRWPY